MGSDNMINRKQTSKFLMPDWRSVFCHQQHGGVSYKDSSTFTGMKSVCSSSAILAASLLISACTGGDEVPALPDEANQRISITNNLAALNERVAYTEETVDIEGGSGTPPALLLPSAAKFSNTAISLTLVAEILPPIVDGQVVQATSVTLRNNAEGLVSYNMQGAPRLGAVDFIKRFNSNSPSLTSSITFNDSDVNSVASDGSFVYTAVATNDVNYLYPAVLERIKIIGNSLTLQDNSRIPLVSYAGTSVLPADKVIYTTSGNTGNVSGFDDKDLDLLGEFSLDDARWVALDEENKRIVVAQGTPGRLSIFKEKKFPGGSMEFQNTFTFPGANVPESKSTVEVAGGKAFIAAGPEGVQIMCLDNGQIIGSIPRPDPASLGLDPSVVVTNAVSVDEELIFISNGEAGVYVARGTENFHDNNCNTPGITMLGKLRFDDLQSANHVAYRSGYLYVAAGLGGVKIVRVSL